MNGRKIEYEIPFNPEYPMYGYVETNQIDVFTYNHMDLLETEDSFIDIRIRRRLISIIYDLS